MSMPFQRNITVGDADWTFSVNVREAGGDTFTREYEETLHFEAVADAPTLAADDVAGMENTWIDMDITTALVDADGSESLSVYIADVPDGVSFNAGTKLTSSVTLADGTTPACRNLGCGSRRYCRSANTSGYQCQ